MKSLLTSILIQAFLAGGISSSVAGVPPSDKALSAAKGGVHGGGGGNAKEIPLDLIRADAALWLERGGAKAMKFFDDDHYEKFVADMSLWFLPKVIALTMTSDYAKVKINGYQKLCRGFFDDLDGLPHMICHEDLVDPKKYNDDDRYRNYLHEVFALALYEKNAGAASDYQYSNQLVASLEWRMEKRLAVKSVLFTPIEDGCKISFGKVPAISRMGAPNVNLNAYQRRNSHDSTLSDDRLHQLGYDRTSHGNEIEVEYTWKTVYWLCDQLFMWTNIGCKDGVWEVASREDYLHYHAQEKKITHTLMAKIIHRQSGFSLEFGPIAPSGPQPDSRRGQLQHEFDSAPTPADRLAAKDRLRRAEYGDFKGQTAMEATLGSLPSCAKFYDGKL